MSTTAAKTEINGVPSAVQSEGNTGTVFCQQDIIKLCVRMNVTCISREGYTCLHSGACQPCNAEGEVLTDAGWTAYPRRGGIAA